MNTMPPSALPSHPPLAAPKVREAGTPRDAAEARRTSLLAVLSGVQAIMALAGAAQAHLFAPLAGSRVVPVVLIPSAVGYLVAFVLARSGHGKTAARLTVLIQCAIPTAIRVGLDGQGFPAMSAAAWLSIPILTANATIHARGVLAAGATATATFLVSMVATSAEPQEIGEGLVFLATTTGATIAYSLYRDRLERERQLQLQVRNDELEALRATLELEVQARTLELRTSYDALATNQAVLLRTEHMAAIGRLTAGFAHELATPLSAILSTFDEMEALRAEYADSINDPGVKPADHHEIAGEMAKALAIGQMGSARAIRFVRGMRSHSRDAARCPPERFNPVDVASEALDLLAYEARSARASLIFEPSATPVYIVGAPNRLGQALTNLLKNAIDAVGESGRAGTVTTSIAACSTGVTIRVADSGPGIPPTVLPQIFEPMFTTKAYGKGTGLGLAIVREVVQVELGGSLTIDTSPERGTTFTLQLPHTPTRGDAHGPQATPS